MIKAVKEARKQGVVKGVLWHQGESNSWKSDAYPAKLKALVEQLRKDLDLPNLPIVYGQIGAWRDSYKAFNEMIVKQPEQLPNTACVKTEGLANKDGAHFNTEGQLGLGRRYAEEMIQLLK